MTNDNETESMENCYKEMWQTVNKATITTTIVRHLLRSELKVKYEAWTCGYTYLFTYLS